MFEERESFKHKMAKDLLYEWLVKINNDGGGELTPFRWKYNFFT